MRRNTRPFLSLTNDYGPHPFTIDIEEATENNQLFRTTLWTGDYLQLALMSILPGDAIGLEVHDTIDQFVRIEEGRGMLIMGDTKDTPNFQQVVSDNTAFIIPAGKWHNLINIGRVPLKLYTLYAPPEHPFGTVHTTKEEADAAHEAHHRRR